MTGDPRRFIATTADMQVTHLDGLTPGAQRLLYDELGLQLPAALTAAGLVDLSYDKSQPRVPKGLATGGEFAKGTLAASGRLRDMESAGKKAVATQMANHGLTDAALDAEIKSRLTPEAISEGKIWYPRAHDFCVAVAAKYGLSEDQAFAIVSALSPQNPWKRNKELTIEVLDAYRNYDGVDALEAAEKIGGGKPVEVSAAVRIARGEDIGKVMPRDNGRNAKRRSFYNNMKIPAGTDDATIDTWMMRAARHAQDVSKVTDPKLDLTPTVVDEHLFDHITNPKARRTAIDKAVKVALDADKNKLEYFLGANRATTGGGAGYVAISESIRRVAAKLKLPPDEVQAAYWVAIRGAAE